jgi:hypothetical protein
VLSLKRICGAREGGYKPAYFPLMSRVRRIKSLRREKGAHFFHYVLLMPNQKMSATIIYNELRVLHFGCRMLRRRQWSFRII